jgi:hypothetical protein
MRQWRCTGTTFRLTADLGIGCPDVYTDKAEGG